MGEQLFLYGASVHGIQAYIFKTNKLKEIVGASSLVEEVCKDLFAKHYHRLFGEDHKENDLLQKAAGSVKYLFRSKEDCQRFARTFPKAVQAVANVGLAQAVVAIGQDAPNGKDFEELEAKLQVDRNKVAITTPLGLMGSQRSRQTGAPTVNYKGDNPVDQDTLQKLDHKPHEVRRAFYRGLFGEQKLTYRDLPEEMADIAERTGNWIAVLHADGNGLGELLRAMREALSDAPGYSKFMKDFSADLEKATLEAAKSAIYEEKLFPHDLVPVLIGGDDVTLVLRAGKALGFAHRFSKCFEEKTAELFGQLSSAHTGLLPTDLAEKLSGGLTICTGIAYIKSNYPMHYGLHLAEELCKESKKTSKQIAKQEDKKGTLPPSSLMFYKVHDSFVKDFAAIKVRELTSPEYPKHPFVAGPYFLRPQQLSGEKSKRDFYDLDKIREQYGRFREENSPSSALRQWVGELYESKALAEQKLRRIRKIKDKYVEPLKLKESCISSTSEEQEANTAALAGRVLDLLTLKAVNTEY